MRLRELIGLLVLGSASISLGSCTVGDAICTDRTVEEDRDDDCPFGPPGGPQKESKPGGCVFEFVETCDVTWAGDVFPILTSPQPGGGPACSNQFCHGPGTPGGADMLVPTDTPTSDELYDILAAVKNEAGDPYIAEDDPAAWFLCNVGATPGGGVAMPPSSGFTAAPAELAILEEWVKCGMKRDGVAGPGVGGGGMGGMGGVGAGGMGGGL